MSTYTTLQKYLLWALVFSIIVLVTIKYVPYFKVEDDKMFRTVVLSYIGFLCVAFIVNKVFARNEHMVGNVTMDINYNNPSVTIVPRIPDVNMFYGAEDDYDTFPEYNQYPEIQRPNYPVINRNPIVRQEMTRGESHSESHHESQPESHPEIKSEGSASCGSCDSKKYLPQAFSLSRWDGDLANTGLQYNNDSAESPYDALLNNQYEGSNIPFREVRKIIDKQRYNSPNYHYHSDGAFQIKDTPYKNGIPYKDAQSVICKSKLNDLYNQHNHYIQASPHTHYGKSRGYMNWEPAL